MNPIQQMIEILNFSEGYMRYKWINNGVWPIHEYRENKYRNKLTLETVLHRYKRLLKTNKFWVLVVQ